jgi:glucoamylase
MPEFIAEARLSAPAYKMNLRPMHSRILSVSEGPLAARLTTKNKMKTGKVQRLGPVWPKPILKTTLIVAIILAWSYTQGVGLAADAPGGPGSRSVWAPAAKDFLGTSASDASRVYFSGAEGIVTEVFYPTVDRVQNVDLQLLIVDAAKTWDAQDAEERKQRHHDVSLVNKRAMIWQAVTYANNGKWKVTKKIFTDPTRNSLIQIVTFQTLEPGKTVKDYSVFVLNNPAINNSGGGEHASGTNDNSRALTGGGRTMLVASEPNSTSSALAVSLPWKVVNGKTMVS